MLITLTPQAVVLILLYLATLGATAYALARVIGYWVTRSDDRARLASRRRAEYEAWVLRQPAEYHDNRMTETYR